MTSYSPTLYQKHNSLTINYLTMKTIVFSTIFLLGNFLFAQVGINTETPRQGAALDVQGSMKAKKVIFPDLPAVTVDDRESFLYLVQDQTDNSLSMLDLTASNGSGGGTAGGISTLLTYVISNVNGDWILNFDTKVNATNYALVVLSASFDRAVQGTNPALPIAGTKIGSGGTWILEADYSAVQSATNGTWTITCVAYPKTYAKIYPQQTVNINSSSTGNNNSGSASQPLIDF